MFVTLTLQNRQIHLGENSLRYKQLSMQNGDRPLVWLKRSLQKGFSWKYMSKCSIRAGTCTFKKNSCIWTLYASFTAGMIYVCFTCTRVHFSLKMILETFLDVGRYKFQSQSVHLTFNMIPLLPGPMDYTNPWTDCSLSSIGCFVSPSWATFSHLHQF